MAQVIPFPKMCGWCREPIRAKAISVIDDGVHYHAGCLGAGVRSFERFQMNKE